MNNIGNLLKSIEQTQKRLNQFKTSDFMSNYLRSLNSIKKMYIPKIPPIFYIKMNC